MKSLYINRFLYFAVLGTTGSVVAQNSTEAFVNQGSIISVAPTGVMSTAYSFDNKDKGTVASDGTTYYYRDFNNDGAYSTLTNQKKAKAVFKRFDNETGKQIISGDGLSSFHDVELDNATPITAFDLKNNIDVYGTVDFRDGIIQVDSTLNPRTKLSNGMLSFQKGAKAINVKDASHAEGEVEKIGNEEFTFPKGDKGFYRLAKISAPKEVTDAFVGKYMLDDKRFFDVRKVTSGVINQLDRREYWLVDRGNNIKSEVVVTLSWDARTTPPELLANPEKDLHIVRYDEKLQMWVDEGGVVDMDTKTISTPAVVNGYGFFTLATVKTDWLLDGDVVIYNLVTPDGDGRNDYFLIDNINKYPNNHVEIFNRWGVKVYETSNYDNKDLKNVFRGYSEGRVTMNKNEKLPTGTYFYIVSYEYKDAKGNNSKMVKKSGYLHLESN
ncbi:MAG: gliding motility-associated C-terminal domain-containing protein [Flavobacteriaceae bacterium]|jgi:gliding motility-associated-like protein|nr:gliding motility-associated C-terminal domain-containing protein [Flavobacteriaceae bacterium]